MSASANANGDIRDLFQTTVFLSNEKGERESLLLFAFTTHTGDLYTNVDSQTQHLKERIAQGWHVLPLIPKEETQMELTRDLAWTAAQDAANRQMRAANRSKWSRDDYELAVETFDRLWPEEKDYRKEPATSGGPGPEAVRRAAEQILQDAIGPLGRVTRLPYQHTHHADGDPTNSDLDNLEVRTGYADIDPDRKGQESVLNRGMYEGWIKP